MFTPIETTIGALLMHQATSNLLYLNGNILGMSGYLRQVFSAPTKEVLAFFVGMAASYPPLKTLTPQLITSYPAVQITPQAAAATISIGAMVGWGTKVSEAISSHARKTNDEFQTSNGCTSGHMLCGLSRLSGRSATAVFTFFPVAIITHHLAHPTLSTSACPGDVPCYTTVYPTPQAVAFLTILAALSILAAQTIPRMIANVTASETRGDGKKQLVGPHTLARVATQFFSGLLFALGLHISGMAHSAKVASFLSFPVLEHWDPSLGLVILFGVLPNLIENQLRGFSTPPLFAKGFSLPTKTFKDVDKKFVAGAAVFGVGLGLVGTCPGPAVLRAFFQPLWGALWIGGFWLGGKLGY
jgi:uncharacterized membrane protein YedE/YeeE